MPILIGEDNFTKHVSRIYANIHDKAKRISNVYVGVDNKAKRIAPLNSVMFDIGNHYWTVPLGISNIWITAIGGGGGGGSGGGEGSSYYGGGGGAGGSSGSWVFRKLYHFEPGQQLSMRVGFGGRGGVHPGGSGNGTGGSNGGYTSIDLIQQNGPMYDEILILALDGGGGGNPGLVNVNSNWAAPNRIEGGSSFIPNLPSVDSSTGGSLLGGHGGPRRNNFIYNNAFNLNPALQLYGDNGEYYLDPLNEHILASDGLVVGKGGMCGYDYGGNRGSGGGGGGGGMSPVTILRWFYDINKWGNKDRSLVIADFPRAGDGNRGTDAGPSHGAQMSPGFPADKECWGAGGGGAGGSGGRSASGTNTGSNGGDGADGVIIFEWIGVPI